MPAASLATEGTRTAAAETNLRDSRRSKGTGGVKASRGAIDEYGRVFDGGDVKLSDTHDGLFVVDGSAIPGALAMNPTLTITAQALKAVGHVLGSGAVSAPQANP